MVGTGGGSPLNGTARALLLIGLLLHAATSDGASLKKARKELAEGRLEKAREQLQAVIRKGNLREEDEARFTLARIYFLEKDFRNVVRTLLPAEKWIPDSKTGDWTRILLYKAARLIRDRETAGRQYRALLRTGRDFPVGEIEEHFGDLVRVQLMPGRGVPLENERWAGRAAGDPSETESAVPRDPLRQELFFVAESLMSLQIDEGASKIWTALTTAGPDDIARTALLRAAQTLESQGKPLEAWRSLKLFVLLFSEDPRAADALYRLAKWSALRGSDETARLYLLLAEHYPATLYGVLAKIDVARTWPTEKYVQAAVRAIREAQGLPDAVFERGLALALTYPHLLKNDADRDLTRKVYRSFFPMGPLSRSAADPGK